MCNYDVYRGRKISEQKKPGKLSDLISYNADAEYVTSSAMLVKAVSILHK